MIRKSRNTASDYGNRPDLDSVGIYPAVRHAEQMRVLDARYPRAGCWEWCGECETEFLMSAYHPEACPYCGIAVLPCNMCDQETIDCQNCPFQSISGTRIGPDNRPDDYIDFNRKSKGVRRGFRRGCRI